MFVMILYYNKSDRFIPKQALIKRFICKHNTHYLLVMSKYGIDSLHQSQHRLCLLPASATVCIQQTNLAVQSHQ